MKSAPHAVPRFTVIVPAFNAAAFIQAALQSVIEQTFPDWEAIVVDDGSTDGTPAIVKEVMRGEPRIRLLHQCNRKQAAARNAGLRAAAGEWVAFLDADDLWLQEKLRLQSELIASRPDVDVVFSDGYTLYEATNIRTAYHYPLRKGFLSGRDFYPEQLLANYIPNLSVAFRRSWVDRVGYLDEDLRIAGCEDHDYWLRLMRAGANFYGMEQRLFVYRIHRANFSSHSSRQLYSSYLVRLNNVEPDRIPRSVSVALWAQFTACARQLRHEGHAGWSTDLRKAASHSGLRVSAIDRAQILGVRVVRYVRRRAAWEVKRVLRWLARRTYFPARKRLSRLGQRVHAAYVNWELEPHITTPGSLRIDPTARIVMCHASNRINAARLTVCDYSRITLINEQAEIVAGTDVLIARFCTFNVLGRVVLGNNVLFNNYCSVNCFEEILIGDNSWFGEGVRFYDHNHRYKSMDVPFTDQGYTVGRIIVGRNVWIGSNTVILKGVSIGDGCVIGANNLIYKSLPAGSMVRARAMDDISVVEREA